MAACLPGANRRSLPFSPLAMDSDDTTRSCGGLAILYRCRLDLRGEVRAWVIATGSDANKTYLDGSGEGCASTPGSGNGLVPFTVPANADVVTIWLQATGSGEAIVGPISLHPLD